MSVEAIEGFRNWLQSQRDRQDPVGDFARDFLADHRMRGLSSISSIDRVLVERRVGQKVLDARDRAWREYAESRQ